MVVLMYWVAIKYIIYKAYLSYFYCPLCSHHVGNTNFKCAGVYFPSCATTREINTKIALEWAQKQFVTRVHTLFHFLHDITYPKMTLKTRIFTHHPRLSLARLTLRWWRPNRLVMTSQWPDNCDANTWQVISISLDIDFIHGDIHGRSCKKRR